eukprot:CAMPEP_0176400700 /NCGR_PEP_ID=MMETSP0126-20121128/47815_1 /TAXON_ID=141414 ORGANISM="Strombidinopsis acuminatum, Strain SPMC142" /NCGR_SAMPLE_ID=MMETSP0126 /ASSEMBLY_ACC=CAM_ASM_000229 /LENGTH=116 /DNA_ID=CAMNT_0017777129 /DNA_START=420 /DNA_END=773 /DNA_ORIENTATION=+
MNKSVKFSLSTKNSGSKYGDDSASKSKRVDNPFVAIRQGIADSKQHQKDSYNSTLSPALSRSSLRSKTPTKRSQGSNRSSSKKRSLKKQSNRSKNYGTDEQSNYLEASQSSFGLSP